MSDDLNATDTQQAWMSISHWGMFLIEAASMV